MEGPTHLFHPGTVVTLPRVGHRVPSDVGNIGLLMEQHSSPLLQINKYEPSSCTSSSDPPRVHLLKVSLKSPPDLLEERQSPHILEPYSTISSPESVYAATIYPGFYLQDPSTTLVLSSIRDHPIRLDSALAPGLVASYPLVNQNTEAFVCPHSLLFTRDGTRFLAGSDSMISVFDVARSGSEPLTQLLTIPSKRSKNLGGGVGMKGIISALGLEPNTSVLAAGTFSGQVGLYSDNGEGDTIGVFSLAGSNAHDTIGGHGVTQVKWSPCGKYLYVVERMSDGVLIYDIRDTGQLLGWLTGRKAMTNERMGVDLHTTSEVGNYDIWAGGTDGSIRVWTDPHQQEGGQEPVSKWNAHDGKQI